MTVGSRSFHCRVRDSSFWYERSYPVSQGTFLARASNETGVGKMAKNVYFQPIHRYIAETIEDRYIVTIKE